MTFSAYTNPDFTYVQKLIFFLMCFGSVLFFALLILLFVKLQTSSLYGFRKQNEFYLRAYNRLSRFYELIIACTSVMSFSCAYVVINHISALAHGGAAVEEGTVLYHILYAWDNGRDFVLLLLICLSCVFNSIIDNFIIPIKDLKKEEKASMRMLAMFYVIFILIVLNQIGDESEYNPVMMYYLGLMVGRFVYFDASFKDFWAAIKNIFRNSPFLLMMLILSGGMCYLGFQLGYLLERNYFIVCIFYTHLFLLAAVFIIKNLRLLGIFIKKPSLPYENVPESADPS